MPRTVPVPAATAPQQPMPSIHVRAVVTWIAIFPLVTIGLLALTPVTEGWPMPLRTLVLTVVVVPLAVYVVVPQLLRGYGMLRRRGRPTA